MNDYEALADRIKDGIAFATRDSHRHTLVRWKRNAPAEGRRESDEWSRMVEAVNYFRSNK